MYVCMYVCKIICCCTHCNYFSFRIALLSPTFQYNFMRDSIICYPLRHRVIASAKFLTSLDEPLALKENVRKYV